VRQLTLARITPILITTRALWRACVRGWKRVTIVWDTAQGIHTGFRATEHGFRFANCFSWDSVGHMQRWLVARAGIRLLRLPASALGLCGGMCLAALDLYHAGRRVPTDEAPPAPESPLFRYLWRRQLDSYGGLRVPLRVLAWMWRRDQHVDRLTIAEFVRLQSRLSGGAPTPLVLVRTRGATDPTANHQVLALGYTWEPHTRRATIQIYDPNHPLIEPTVSFTLAPGDRLHDLHQSTGEAVRGFFVEYYRPRAMRLPA
jgi:hypothetical protein